MMSKNLDFHLPRMSPYPEGHGRFIPASRLCISDIGAVGRFHMRTTTILPSMAACAQAGARMHEGLPSGAGGLTVGRSPGPVICGRAARGYELGLADE